MGVAWVWHGGGVVNGCGRGGVDGCGMGGVDGCGMGGVDGCGMGGVDGCGMGVNILEKQTKFLCMYVPMCM